RGLSARPDGPTFPPPQTPVPLESAPLSPLHDLPPAASQSHNHSNAATPGYWMFAHRGLSRNHFLPCHLRLQKSSCQRLSLLSEGCSYKCVGRRWCNPFQTHSSGKLYRTFDIAVLLRALKAHSGLAV